MLPCTAKEEFQLSSMKGPSEPLHQKQRLRWSHKVDNCKHVIVSTWQITVKLYAQLCYCSDNSLANVQVNIVGEKIVDPIIHLCETCSLPILLYGRVVSTASGYCVLLL